MLNQIQIYLTQIKILKEFSQNPFTPRIIDVLIARNGSDTCSLRQFLSLMWIFCYSTPTYDKKVFMFQIYDNTNRGSIPIENLRNILTQELFVRSHYDDVDEAKELRDYTQIKSSYTDKTMREIMVEIMDEYDTDGNKEVDMPEFMYIVSDHDVDMLLSLY